MLTKSATGIVRRVLMTTCMGVSGLHVAAQSMPPAPLPGPALQVYAAGSLRDSLTDLARAYTLASNVTVALTFGASGLLRERIEQGESAQVFASADTQHPEKLFGADASWQKPVPMVRNKLCALANPKIKATPANLLTLLLDPALKLGTSTPGADPAGDYAWALFRRAEAVAPGAYAALDAKARPLTGSASTPQTPAGRGTYAWLMDEGRADLFLTYCTNAIAAQKEVPRLSVVALPPALEVGAVYGVTAKGADAVATQFVQYLLSPAAQAVFARYGFGAP